MAKKILITGATGLVGSALKKRLLGIGYEVNTLSRKPEGKNAFGWDVYNQKIDVAALNGVDAIIHLAGEPVADKKWTAERKKQIIDSRVKSAVLLFEAIKKSENHKIKSFVSASAVGFYGDCGDEILTEDSPNGFGFLAECCKLWEQAVDEGKKLSLRIVKLRTGIVLSKDGGALPQLDLPVRLFAGSAIGTGKQWTPWLHLTDMVNMYVEAVENIQMEGSYNACAPFPVTNKTLTKAIAKQLHRPFWPMKVPKAAIELLLGERVEAVLMSNNTSAQKLLDAGFKFTFTNLEEALKDIYSPNTDRKS
ncbi:TIGR01777 family oxidoreductase [Pedobacter sp. Leaf194]|uniref:TIGR01777 family oxidoreductase n=1 Tax=Pedobacter sp. Leaf194 TaxID=1736297 RepID=UPI0007035368|nr:TIGR01777 family oxidoreductase [Pedobacter sp. Leaf194]KQS41547.1 cell division inhibitor [Pedobacter sp. Leaf194]